MIRIRDISLSARAADDNALIIACAKQLRLSQKDIMGFKIFRRSVDARKKSDVRIIFTVDVKVRGYETSIIKKLKSPNIFKAEYNNYTPPRALKTPANPPVVVGFGPAGMFAALVLAEAGLSPIVLERGLDADTRSEKVAKFWQTGELDPECNVQFGEGGAGTFSDGKLNTGTKNPRIPWVLQQFVSAGAQENILYDAKPHVGTDILRTVVKNIRERIISLGGTVKFGTKLTGIDTDDTSAVKSILAVSDGAEITIPCSSVLLAIGHSARDTFEMLNSSGVSMAPKAFSMGVRIEHPQKLIDKSQYGDFAGAPALAAADYKLNCRTEAGSAYTFCMCPGGYVVAAASEEGGVVTNGMSYSGRDGDNANSALLVGLEPSDFPYSGALGGMYWQRELEQRAYKMGGCNYHAPCETVGCFLGQKSVSGVTPTYKPGTTPCDLHDLFPDKISKTLELALPELDKWLHGFASSDAVMTAPETRSSSPVRIIRDDSLNSVSHLGLYPCGEGAGYAGGIVSAAVDGILCAEAVIQKVNKA